MWSQKENQTLQKTFAWVNVVAIIIGFWTYFGATTAAALAGWLMAVNIVNIILAVYQFYYGYKNNQSQSNNQNPNHKTA